MLILPTNFTLDPAQERYESLLLLQKGQKAQCITALLNLRCSAYFGRMKHRLQDKNGSILTSQGSKRHCEQSSYPYQEHYLPDEPPTREVPMS